MNSSSDQYLSPTCRRHRRHRRKEAGFTLIEVLVAFAVLALSLGVIMHIFSLSMRNTQVADYHQRALLLAESRLAELVAEPELREGRSEGALEPPFEWSARVESWTFPDQEPLLEYPQMPYRVRVTVSWGEREAERLSLSTIHLVTEFK